MDKPITDFTDKQMKEILNLQALRCAAAAEEEMLRNGVIISCGLGRQILDVIIKCGEVKP